MNQKGFATIFGLCLILVIALCVKGIEEAEMNHAYETADFQAEFDLQSAADSGIYMAVANIKQGLIVDKEYLPFNKKIPADKRIDYQKKVIDKSIEASSGNIKVTVWAERVLVYPYSVDYNNFNSYYQKYIAKLVDKDKPAKQRAAYILFSKAELKNAPRIGGRLYRRSFAYVALDEEGNSDKTIHFMEIAADNIRYEPECP